MPGFSLRPIHVGFVVNKVAVGTGTGVSPWSSVLPCQIISPVVHTY